MNRMAALILAAGVMAGAFALFGGALFGTARAVKVNLPPEFDVMEGLDSEPKATETRQVGSFDRIRASGAVEVETTGGSEPLVVTAPKSQIRDFLTEVVDGVLVLRWKSSGIRRGKVTVTVGAGGLKGAELSSASSLVATGFKASKFELKASGASQAELTGSVGQLFADLSGSSEAEADLEGLGDVTAKATGASSLQLTGGRGVLSAEAQGASSIRAPGEFRRATVEASGASTIEAGAKEAITGEASGASSIVTLGSPSRNEVRATGASSVSRG